MLRSFQDLQNDFDIPKQAFFSYLQIRHYAQSLVPNLQFSPLTEFEKLCLEGSSPKGMIMRTTSCIYGKVGASPGCRLPPAHMAAHMVSGL